MEQVIGYFPIINEGRLNHCNGEMVSDKLFPGVFAYETKEEGDELRQSCNIRQGRKGLI